MRAVVVAVACQSAGSHAVVACAAGAARVVKMLPWVAAHHFGDTGCIADVWVYLAAGSCGALVSCLASARSAGTPRSAAAC